MHVCLLACTGIYVRTYNKHIYACIDSLIHFAGLGDYHLKVSYLNARIEVEDLDLISTRSPEIIVEQMKLKNSKENVSSSDEITPCDLEPTDQNSFHQPLANSIYSRAEDLIRNNKIIFNPQMHVFNVQGTKEVRVVKLHPKESCSCPATGTCYHILGVKLSLGLKVFQSTTSERNLTKLCKATRSRKEKKTGRKRPRPNDVHVDLNENNDCSMSKRRKKSEICNNEGK